MACHLRVIKHVDWLPNESVRPFCLWIESRNGDIFTRRKILWHGKHFKPRIRQRCLHRPSFALFVEGLFVKWLMHLVSVGRKEVLLDRENRVWTFVLDNMVALTLKTTLISKLRSSEVLIWEQVNIRLLLLKGYHLDWFCCGQIGNLKSRVLVIITFFE